MREVVFLLALTLVACNAGSVASEKALPAPSPSPIVTPKVSVSPLVTPVPAKLEAPKVHATIGSAASVEVIKPSKDAKK